MFLEMLKFAVNTGIHAVKLNVKILLSGHDVSQYLNELIEDIDASSSKKPCLSREEQLEEVLEAKISKIIC